MRRRNSLAAITTVTILVVILHYIGWLIPVENFLRSIVNRGSAIAYEQGLEINKIKFKTVQDLENAYKDAIEKNIEQEGIVARIKLLEEQNKKLRQELNYLTTTTYQYLGAEIIGKNVDPIANTLIINRGTKDNIKVGNPAIAYNGILVGKIIRTEADTSIIRLLQDGQSKIAATLLNLDYSIGLIEGGYGVSVQMNFIPENEKIEINDQVVTSGLEEGIPRGLLIGNVKAVKKEAYEPFQQAIVKPAIQTNLLDSVVIITNKL